jgi:DNA invertase Pin-like site-specific DNA recombinase
MEYHWWVAEDHADMLRSLLRPEKVRQLDGVELDKIFADKASGKDVNRAQLQAALEYLRDGDVLVCHSMDRLARNLDDFMVPRKRPVCHLAGEVP